MRPKTEVFLLAAAAGMLLSTAAMGQFIVSGPTEFKYGEGSGTGAVTSGKPLESDGDIDLFLDRYIPLDPGDGITPVFDATKPIILLAPGGGFRDSKKAGKFPLLRQIFVGQGYVVLIIDYREMPNDPPASAEFIAAVTPLVADNPSIGTTLDSSQGALNPIVVTADLVAQAMHAGHVDLQQAIRFTHKEVMDPGGSLFVPNNGRLVIGGNSAGAFISVGVGLGGSDFANSDLDDDVILAVNTPLSVPSSVAAIINMAGAGAHVDGTLTAFSLPSLLDDEDPPVLIVHGTEDTTAPFILAELLADALLAANLPFKFLVLEGEGHNFNIGSVTFEGTLVSDLIRDFVVGTDSISTNIDGEIVNGDTVTLFGPARASLYQWQKFNDGTSLWENLSDDARITGTTSRKLTFDPVLEEDSGDYRTQYDDSPGSRGVILVTTPPFTMAVVTGMPIAGAFGLISTLAALLVAGAFALARQRRKS